MPTGLEWGGDGVLLSGSRRLGASYRGDCFLPLQQGDMRKHPGEEPSAGEAGREAVLRGGLSTASANPDDSCRLKSQGLLVSQDLWLKGCVWDVVLRLSAPVAQGRVRARHSPSTTATRCPVASVLEPSVSCSQPSAFAALE